ncbi:hypothetical protein [Mucilaginibacter sp. L3T2-6]|uniref:hypothetical protein n=1 Tax=Mucilaginibacter sp. L3T2-6 TaxID=3062491 RepID=UPI0026761DA8|nr:hypothetical protein [Mucilaginibacter sp. L3T2-6]MDO3641942.1 hypothetical protein [Mucilaginibacter sp. L3T2-6]MDV6214380.1 hypothetical protein [Mucilaginibacter sp. L3T2-6]
MQSKEKNLKTICPENETAEIPLPAEKVAEITGKSTSLVKKVRTGKRNPDSDAGKAIQVVDDLWAYGSNKLITEIKRIVKL